MSHIYCPECGFQNPEAANYCSKCGALLVRDESGEKTMTYVPEEAELSAEQTTIGRSPDCDIFLDDVTVSRRHAVVSRKNGELTIEDLGSLNGTFLNRRRIETGALTDGDELQIGKYRLTFLQ